jgi:hypothetical protein
VRRLLLATALLLPSATAIAQSQCEAENDFGEQCSANCPVPQAGVCVPGVGPEPPLCFCVGMDRNPAGQAGGGGSQQDDADDQ